MAKNKVNKTPGPDQNLPGVQDSLAYRNANMDMMVLTGLLSIIGWFVGGTVSALLLGGSPWFYQAPFLSAKDIGFNLYTLVPVLVSLFKFKDYPEVIHAAWVGIGIFLVMFGTGWWLGARRARRARDKLLKSDAHGSAHWATREEIEETGLIPKTPSPNACYVGGWVDDKNRLHYLQHSGPEHVIAFAPTRSGKGVGLVIPTLLAWQGSALVHDIKGENWALTAGYRQSIGQRCLKFAPTLSDGTSCKFNPLNEIRVGTDKEVSDTQNIATMIVDPDGKGLNDHWAKTGFALLVGTILHVLYATEVKEKTLKAVANLLSDPNVTSVDEVFEHMKTYEHDKSGARGWLDLHGNPTRTHPVVAQSAQEMLNKADNEKSGVISTAMSFLSLYRDPVVAANVDSSDFRITDLMGDAKGEKVPPVSLYLVVPPSDKDRLKPLIRLVLNQVVRRLTESMEFKDGRGVDGFQHRLLLMIDEFPSLGKLDIFAESLAYVAGYGMKMYLICQDTAQLYKEYTKDETIIPNCHVRVVYAPNRLETAEWLSKILGKKTLVTENTTFSYNGQFMPYQTGMSGGLQYAGRELLTTEEVMSLRGPTKDARGNITLPGAMITLIAGKAPVYGTQMLYFQDPTFLARAKLPAPDSAGLVEQGDSAAAVVTAAAVEALGDRAKETGQIAALDAPETFEPEPISPEPPARQADVSGLDALDFAGEQAAVADEEDRARAAAEQAAMRNALDLLSANTEVALTEAAVDEDNRLRDPELDDFGAMQSAIPMQAPPSRVREHRALDKKGIAMLLGRG